MENKILMDVKEMVGVHPSYNCFDNQIIFAINTSFSVLTQLGVGPKGGFSIQGDEEEWSDFIDDMSKIEMIRNYVGISVRLLFDTPTNGAVREVLENKQHEYEWRLNAECDKT